jgi:hypothetical protein
MADFPSVYVDHKLYGKQGLLMNKLTDFYNDSDIVEELLPIINGTTKLSLRIIDWFVTNYSKKNNVVLYIPKIKPERKLGKKTLKKKLVSTQKNKPESAVDTIDESYEQFIVYIKYKLQLNAFSKKQFDPFCRRERIKFYYGKDQYIVTTVGQLNFFKWAIENGIIDYIKHNLDEIDVDMNKNIRKNYSDKKKSLKKTSLSLSTKEDLSLKNRNKRRELSACATKQLNRHNHNIVLSFD